MIAQHYFVSHWQQQGTNPSWFVVELGSLSRRRTAFNSRRTHRKSSCVTQMSFLAQNMSKSFRTRSKQFCLFKKPNLLTPVGKMINNCPQRFPLKQLSVAKLKALPQKSRFDIFSHKASSFLTTLSHFQRNVIGQLIGHLTRWG